MAIFLNTVFLGACYIDLINVERNHLDGIVVERRDVSCLMSPSIII